MTTRNASNTTGARRPWKRKRIMLGWNDELTQSLLTMMSRPEHNKKYHLHPTKFCKDVARLLFNDESRDKAVYAKIDYLKRRYFDLKAKNEAGYTGPVRFEFYDECQRVFDPQLTSLSTLTNAASPDPTTPLPTTTVESSAPIQLARPMMVQNTPCHDSDDNVSSIDSRDNTSVHYYTAEQPDQNQELASPVTSFITPEPTNNENSHSNRNTDHPSGSSNMNEDKVQLQLQMMQHEEKMANLRIRELELILEITKEQEKLSSHHTSTLLRPSIATAIRPSYM